MGPISSFSASAPNINTQQTKFDTQAARGREDAAKTEAKLADAVSDLVGKSRNDRQDYRRQQEFADTKMQTATQQGNRRGSLLDLTI